MEILTETLRMPWPGNYHTGFRTLVLIGAHGLLAHNSYSLRFGWTSLRMDGSLPLPEWERRVYDLPKRAYFRTLALPDCELLRDSVDFVGGRYHMPKDFADALLTRCGHPDTPGPMMLELALKEFSTRMQMPEMLLERDIPRFLLQMVPVLEARSRVLQKSREEERRERDRARFMRETNNEPDT